MNNNNVFLINLLKQFLKIDSKKITEGEILRLDWEDVLFQATVHRILPILYKEILNCNLAYLLNANLLKLLQIFSQQTKELDLKLQLEACALSEMINENNMDAVIMKGPLNSFFLYPESGYRIYEDIDILVSRNKLKEMKGLLAKNGYKQGTIEINSQSFKGASREDILLKEMCTHETVEYHKLDINNMSDDIMIDVNHSLSWKGHDNYRGFPHFSAINLLKRRKIYVGYNMKMIGPAPEDLLLHLILHLFNEAIFFCWQICWYYNFGDIQLIKYVDILLAFKKIDNWDFVDSLIVEYDISEPVEYVMTCINELFGENAVPNELKKYIVSIDKIDFYYNKSGKKVFWKLPIITRVFNQKLSVDEALKYNSKEEIM
ncbi:nucleotidyltransferase family protein [Paenibacillus zanthoxyli]|uniref:nucleotidyltransferase family protein n=1 Tax=Paenibacillus zanthoxyli TaxID=369399 RepID=UPI000472DE54|nr:nucleotidyltransferase family protein [Paenibacillus zanthoxyli]